MPSVTSQLGNITITGNYMEEIGKFTGTLGLVALSLAQAPPHIQNVAADVIADLYRGFLRKGVGDNLARLTKILTGDHPPLSGLADHVIVIKASSRGEGKPAVVTFEPEWMKIAFLHDRGYAIKPTDRQKALIGAAIAITGSKDTVLEDGMGSGGSDIWLIPARPHIFFLRGSVIDSALRIVATSILSGKGIPDISSSRPASPAWRPPISIPFDSIQVGGSPGGSVPVGSTGSGRGGTTKSSSKPRTILRKRR